MSALAKQEDRAAAGLALLEQQIKRELEVLDYPSAPWVRPRTHASGAPVYDVAIIGGGQSGLAAAHGLMREKVSNILVLDENPAGREGPWSTYARMLTLRTPKHITGIEYGYPSLTFRAYWEAQYGPEGWLALGKIARGDWAAYLAWFRRVLNLPVVNEARVTAITPEPGGGMFALNVLRAGAPTRLFARKVVLATGIQGGGEWHVPAFIRTALPKSLYAHTSEAIDFERLKGKRIGVLGAGASAFDNTQHALSCGVAQAHVFVRREALPRVNPIRHMEGSGLLKHFASLDDARKYRAIDYFLRANQPPTNDTFNRAAAYPGFHLHLGAPWTKVEPEGQGQSQGQGEGMRVRVHTPKGAFLFDFLIVSTGMINDLSLREELGELAGEVALWRDRFRPAPGAENPLIDAHPYLGPGFELQGRTREAGARLHGLFLFNYAALVSLGLSGSALSGMKHALPRLLNGVTSQLFLDDQDAVLADFLDYREVEFVGEWPGGGNALG